MGATSNLCWVRSFTKRLVLSSGIVIVAMTSATAQDRAAVQADFEVWLEQTVWPQAQARGVARATFDAGLNGVQLDWDQPSLIFPDGFAPQEQAKAFRLELESRGLPLRGDL